MPCQNSRPSKGINVRSTNIIDNTLAGQVRVTMVICIENDHVGAIICSAGCRQDQYEQQHEWRAKDSHNFHSQLAPEYVELPPTIKIWGNTVVLDQILITELLMVFSDFPHGVSSSRAFLEILSLVKFVYGLQVVAAIQRWHSVD